MPPSHASRRTAQGKPTPKIGIVLLDRKDQPSVGGSETPIVTIAPAVGNAIHAATGVRLRSLPMEEWPQKAQKAQDLGCLVLCLLSLLWPFLIVKALGFIALGLALGVTGIYVGDTDDAPGAALLGILLMIGFVVLGMKAARSRR